VLRLNRNTPERRSAALLNAITPLRHFLLIQLFQAKINNQKRCCQVRFSSSKYTKNAFAAGTSHRTLQGGLTALPRPHSRFSGVAAREGGGVREGELREGKRKGRKAFPTSFFYHLTTCFATDPCHRHSPGHCGTPGISRRTRYLSVRFRRYIRCRSVTHASLFSTDRNQRRLRPSLTLWTNRSKMAQQVHSL